MMNVQYRSESCNPSSPVHYEDFGAKGDGVADDLPAICAAHEHANARGLSVRGRPDATYHLGRRALTVVIATDTDWNTARFTIDDTEVENHQASLFEVRSLLPPVEVRIERLTQDQRRIEVRPERDCHVRVEDDTRRRYLRRGLNRSAGALQHDCFVLHRDGTVEGDIDWEYERITRIEAHPLDEAPLTLRGGIFTTYANRMRQDVGYNYWARDIVITRSNTTVEGLTHYVVGETEFGHPYRGFLNIRQCANVTLRDCFATGHKIYTTQGSAGKPVKMGSYDFHANDVVNLQLLGCRMNHILDRTRWGVVATNFCKNILLEDCTLSRMDTHMGVSGDYTIRRCTLGHMGINAIGRGRLRVEASTLQGPTVITFRSDYGSTWHGDVQVRHCLWIPACGDRVQPHLFGVTNDGMHDFGYPCAMPRNILVDSLRVDDTNHPEDYAGPFLFTDPDAWGAAEDRIPLPEERPFPYERCRSVRYGRLETATGKRLRLSPNPGMAATTTVIEEP